MLFQDRSEAGRLLAERLADLSGRKDLQVLAIPRGGVVVGHVVARALGAPLDVIITRKIGAPHNPELAIGAVSSDGTLVLDEASISMIGVSPEYIREESTRQQEEIRRRLGVYRGTRPAADLAGKCVILTDDGIATGATMEATIQALRKAPIGSLILAVPVAPRDTLERLRPKVDRLVCLHAADLFWAVGGFYIDFQQTSDEEVVNLLANVASTAAHEPPEETPLTSPEK